MHDKRLAVDAKFCERSEETGDCYGGMFWKILEGKRAEVGSSKMGRIQEGDGQEEITPRREINEQ